MRLARVAILVIAAVLAVPASAQGFENLGFADVVTDSLFVTGDSVTFANREGRDTDGFAVVRRDGRTHVFFDRLADPPQRNRFHQWNRGS